MSALTQVSGSGSGSDACEDILSESRNRFVMFPIRYNEIWQMYKKAESAFWTAEELDLSKDMNDWEALTPNEQYFVKNILAFFAASDGIVNENLAVRFMNEVKVPEAKAFYGFQIAMENIHSEVYSLLIDTLIKDPSERHHLFNATQNIPCVAKKANWALKWIESAESFALRLMAFAFVEGVFFSGAFCSIFWLKERGVMPGLSLSNEFISRDESLHTEFAVLLMSLLGPTNKVSQEQAHALAKEAVEIESEFITESIPCNLLGMNSDLMKQYIQYVTDRLLTQMGYAKIYNVKNPFHFMDRICLDGKVNFFEHRESNYAKAGVGLGIAQAKSKFEVLSVHDF